MKLQILDSNGNKIKEIASSIFDGEIRKDIVQKIVEAEKIDDRQPYAPFWLAGLQTSASGNVKHNRHVWKTDRGKGLSRYPKKRMSDKGERFVWTAAVAPGVRGGRRAHPPKLLRRELKINKKEKLLGLKSALAMMSSVDLVKEKYNSLKDKEINLKLPLVVESKMLALKTGEFFDALKKILGEELFEVAVQKGKIRAGRGKMRNRKYKKNAGLLLVIGNEQDKKISGIDVRNIKELRLCDLAANGARLVIFTEEAIKNLGDRIGGK